MDEARESLERSGCLLAQPRVLDGLPQRRLSVRRALGSGPIDVDDRGPAGATRSHGCRRRPQEFPHRPEAQFIGFANHRARFKTAAGKPHGEGVDVMIHHKSRTSPIGVPPNSPPHMTIVFSSKPRRFRSRTSAAAAG